MILAEMLGKIEFDSLPFFCDLLIDAPQEFSLCGKHVKVPQNITDLLKNLKCLF